jgi:flagellar protein FliO/FliZ
VDNLFLAVRVVVSLAAVLGVIWFAQRRLSRGKLLQKAVRDIRVVARQSLGSKASVVLIEADGKRLMLGVTDHSVTVLDSSPLPAPAQPDEPELRSEPERPRTSHVSTEPADFAALLADAEPERWNDAAPVAWKRPRASARRGSHR